jgi:hypothetical protein
MKKMSQFIIMVLALLAAGAVAGYCGLFVGTALYGGTNATVNITFGILGIVVGYLLSSLIVMVVAKGRYFFEGSITLGIMGSLIGSFAIVFILRNPNYNFDFSILTLVLILVPPVLTAAGYHVKTGTAKINR